MAARNDVRARSRPSIRGPALTVALAVAAIGIASSAAAASFGGWVGAANVSTIAGTDPELNTPFTDGCPILSPDGLRLYMASNRPGGLGGLDIWIAERATVSSAWGAPRNAGAPVNSTADDFCPTPVRGEGLFFVSARAGGCGGADIYRTRRNTVHGWTEPRNLGCGVNSAAGEAGPSFVDVDGVASLYFSSARPGGYAADAGATGDADIYVSTQGADGTFGPAELVAGVNTAADDARPNVRKDGLEIVFDSTRSGGIGGADVYAAVRSTTQAGWSTPVNLGTSVNSSANETRASLSWDGRTLVFGSNRAGSELAPDGITPSNDIYLTTRDRG